MIMAETTTQKKALNDPRLKFTCASHCCATFQGLSKDVPWARFSFPLAEGPWVSLRKIERFLKGHQHGADDGTLFFGGHVGMAYGRCGLSELLSFARRHDAGTRSKPRSWSSDADGRLLFEIDGECFGLAHITQEEVEQTFGEWLSEATSEPCPRCGGSGKVWPAGGGQHA